MHLMRERIHGDPLVTKTRAKGTLLDDLCAAAFSETDACVILDGYASRPSVPFNGVTMFASRAVWIIRHGDPGKLLVRHTCNGGSGEHGCINIGHLILGDKAANVQDAVDAGRWVVSSRSGEDVPTHVLTAGQVKTIRERWAAGGVTQKAMATEYGVSRATISLICNGKRWSSVQ